jgi:hypothetical protein
VTAVGRSHARADVRTPWQVLEVTKAAEAGGCKYASLAISGEGAFGSLKFESGVHRVQRVPATEAHGRVHTSTATVAVLPEAGEVRPIGRIRWRPPLTRQPSGLLREVAGGWQAHPSWPRVQCMWQVVTVGRNGG